MEKLKLTDICDFQGGSQPPKEQWINELKDGYIRMLQIRDFTQGKNDKEYVKISNTLKTCEDDDILIARYGASVGKVLSGLSGAYNVAIIKSIPDISKVLKRYLYYYFNTDYFQNRIKSVGSRAAQAGFNKTDLEDFEINIPSLIEQQKIIEILDKSQELIKIRKEQIQALDELVKSQFIEMFGDPIKNTKNFEMKKLKEISTYLKRGVSPKYVENSSIKVINQKCIYWNELKIENCKYYDEAFKNKVENIFLQKNDVLINSTGTGTLGRAMYFNTNDSANYIADSHVTILRVNNEYVSHVFITNLFEFKNIQDTIYKKCVNGSTNQIELSGAKLGEYLIIVPPIELQNQFAEFVKQVDQLKFEMEKSLKELEDNFNSLMQKAFKGELFNKIR